MRPLKGPNALAVRFYAPCIDLFGETGQLSTSRFAT